MSIRDASGIAALLGLAIASGVQAQPPAQKQPLTFPVAIATPPPAALECVVSFGPAVPISALAFSPDGKLLAAGAYQEVLLWDLANGKLAKRIGAGQLGDVVHALAFRKDGKFLVVGEGVPRSSGAVKVFDIDSGQVAAAFQEPKDVVFSAAVSPDGKLLAAGSGDAAAYVWSIDEKKLLTAIKDHTDRVLGVSFSADGKFLVTASADMTAKVWEVGTWKAVARLEQTEPVNGAAFNADGSLVALAIGGPTEQAIRIRRRDNTQLARVLDTGQGQPLDLIWAAQGNRIYVPCSDKTVKVFDANGGQVLNLAGHGDWVYGVALSPDATKLASSSADGTVKLWSAADGRLLATLVQISPRTDEWLIATSQGYLATSSVGALQWKPANLKTPPDKIPGLVQNADLVKQTIAGQKPAPPAVP